MKKTSKYCRYFNKIIQTPYSNRLIDLGTMYNGDPKKNVYVHNKINDSSLANLCFRYATEKRRVINKLPFSHDINVKLK